MLKSQSPRAKKWWLLIVLALVAVVATSAVIWAMWSRAPLVTAPESPPQLVLLQNVRVLDVVGGTLGAASDVLLEGDTIARIAPAGSIAAKGAHVVDGAGGTVMPGLIDSHCHMESSPEAPWTINIPDADLNMERLLFSGVTRTFDPGASVPETFALRADIAAGERLGPTMYAAGPVFTAVNGHPAPMIRLLSPGFLADYLIPKLTRQIGSEEDASREVQALLPHRPDFIKMAVDKIPLESAMLSPELARAIAAAAGENDLRAVAHIGTTQNAIDTGDAGVSAWIHGVYKERIPDADIERLAGYGIPMIPTLIVFKSYAELGRGEFEATELERQLVPAAQLQTYMTVPEDYEQDPDGQAFMDHLREQRSNALDNVARLHAAGVRMLAGSDAQAGVVHGPSLHRELALLTKAGLPPLEVIRAATLYPAQFFTELEDPPFGVVAAGKRADLVVVRGNPLVEPAAVSRIETVVLGGVVLRRHPLP
jgi:imidazolonepropionase-like amidohydrolase